MSPTPEQYERSNRRYIDEWVTANPDTARRILEHFQDAEHPDPIITTSTTKETTMTTNPLTPLQQRRAQAVKDARSALVGGFGQPKTATDIAVIAEYILNGIPADKAEEKAEEKPEAAHWPFYGAAPQRWYVGGVDTSAPWSRFLR